VVFCCFSIGFWNCPDSVVFCRTVPIEKKKYHTVRTVPTSMKNNKIPHCQDSSNRKTTKYHTVRPVPTSMKNNPTVWYFVVFLLELF
jgi:hypothetical protein